MFCLCFQLVPGLKVASHSWTVRSSTAVAAVAKLLEHEQPPRLVVDIPDSVPSPPELRQLMGCVKRHHRGKLELSFRQSYLTFTNCDDILTELSGARLEDFYTTFYQLNRVQCKAVLTVNSFLNDLY